MANVKEIQDRIKSIQDTMKITNAMYMISSSKMKKAKKALSDTEPYFFEMQSAIRRILRHVPDIEHAFFDERPEIPKKDRKIGHIIVNTNRKARFRFSRVELGKYRQYTVWAKFFG